MQVFIKILDRVGFLKDGLDYRFVRASMVRLQPAHHASNP